MITFENRLGSDGLTYTDIVLTRGDDAYISLPIYNADGTEYSVDGSDTVTASVKAARVVDSTAVTAVITGTVTVSSGLAVWHVSHSETDIDAGVYYWDAQITTSDGDVNTIYSGKFTIVGEVTI